jgi:hypothetical protein
MRWVEIISEIKPSGGVPPVSPMTPGKRQTRQDKANVSLRDVQAANGLRLRIAQRKIAEV